MIKNNALIYTDENMNKLDRIISESIHKIIKEGTYNMSANDEKYYRQAQFADELYNYARKFTDNVRKDNSQVGIVIDRMNKFVADKIARLYRNKVKIVQGKNTGDWFIWAL